MNINTKIPSWTDIAERDLLAKLSNEVPAKGLILEIGCLYGGTTAILALSNTEAEVISMDNFSWTPEGYPQTSPTLTRQNLNEAGVQNVQIIEGDSRRLCKGWKRHIDLLWIDGGHSYEFVYSDLCNFGPYADVIALHDYGNPFWETISKAVNDFLVASKSFYISEVVGTVAVLRRK